eukprot:TRINITY_DN8345_c0_g1_i1.p1 TRINITY_DN8345_c0_g1~~TRINITY_DN8345_c0_g1_i1.p1  ORF type:complete len:668 (+),score=214.72 TRINITY_DN8345_c0_g1_i1:353-2356(+)
MNTQNDHKIKKESLLAPNSELSEKMTTLSLELNRKKNNRNNRLLKSSNLKQSTLQPKSEIMKQCLLECGRAGKSETEGYCSECFIIVQESISSKQKEKKPPKIEPTKEDSPEVQVKPIEEKKPVVKKPPKKVEPEKDNEKDDVDIKTDSENSDDDDEDEEEDGSSASGEFDESNLMYEVTKEKEMMFTIVKKKDVEKFMNEVIEELVSLVGMPSEKVGLLLQQFKWDDNHLKSNYFSNMVEYLKKAGIEQEPVVPDKDRDLDEEVDCNICFDEMPIRDTYALDCGHEFYCKGCWRDNLSQLSNSSALEMLEAKCMKTGCNTKLTSLDWKKNADPKDFERFKYFYVKSFVETKKNLSYCPNPSCGNVVQFSGFGKPSDVVECLCGLRFCFSCSLENHNPITCQQFGKWKEKMMDEGASLKLLHTIAKQCPHCGLPTERNQGCNHMTCRKEVGGCSKEWCWVCRGDWKSHGSNTGGYFSCNVYKGSSGEKKDQEAKVYEGELQKFQHYSERFESHEQLKKDAINKKKEISSLGNYFRNKTGQDPQILFDAIELLVQCRHMLKFTYAYAYFLDETHLLKKKELEKEVNNSSMFSKGNNKRKLEDFSSLSKTQKELFLFQQANAEGITERLGELIFSNIDVIISKKDKLSNVVNVAKINVKNLIKSFEDEF